MKSDCISKVSQPSVCLIACNTLYDKSLLLLRLAKNNVVAALRNQQLSIFYGAGTTSDSEATAEVGRQTVDLLVSVLRDAL